MTTASSSSSSSKPRLSPPLPPHHRPHFTPIRECDRENNKDDEFEEGSNGRATPNGPKHRLTPLHEILGSRGKGSSAARRRQESGGGGDAGYGRGGGVSCNKCRPSNREKISVVPLDSNGNSRHWSASPNSVFKSILSSLTKKSPRTSTSESELAREENQWKSVVAELSQKLIQATRKRDEAILEGSKLKYSMAELEKKLNNVEIYCRNLKSGLEVCAKTSPYRNRNNNHAKHDDKVIERFLVWVSEARSNVRVLARSLAIQLSQMGLKVYDRISLLLQPYEIKISPSKNPRSLLLHLEALLNIAFFEDFESIGFQKSAPNQILNPVARCESNLAWFDRLQGLSWEEVLSKGTRHFSEEYSRFCDRKMSEVVAMLGWNRAWPEPVLQAFLGASKSVWLVHLLANSVHPSLPIFRVDKGASFDSVYMEDTGGGGGGGGGGDRTRKLVPSTVRIMVAPGFYVYNNVVKCKVLCRYHSTDSSKINEA